MNADENLAVTTRMALGAEPSILVEDGLESQSMNAVLAQQILALPGNAFQRRSHFVADRYENLYVDVQRLPGLEGILAAIQQRAAGLLHCTPETLRLGFWLNIMTRGQRTYAHRHDEDDELLSGVYYLQAPPGSGELVLALSRGDRIVTPVAGRLVLFPPDLLHEVRAHRSDSPRVALAFNVGPRHGRAD